MERGYVRLPCELLDAGLSAVQLGVFAHCLLSAAPTTRTVTVAGQTVTLEPGQFVFERSVWAEQLGIPPHALRYAMDALRRTTRIVATRLSNWFTVFTVVNSDSYLLASGGGSQPDCQPDCQPDLRACHTGEPANFLEPQGTARCSTHALCQPAGQSAGQSALPLPLPSLPSPSQEKRNTKSKTKTLPPQEPPRTGDRRVIPPKIEWVVAYCEDRAAAGNPPINPQAFFDHYTASGWMRGKSRIRDWQGCVRTWESNRREEASRQPALLQLPGMGAVSGGGSYAGLRVNSVYQQKLVEGEQKARMIQELERRLADEEGENSGSADASEPALSAHAPIQALEASWRALVTRL
jgi:hypothetical protein